MDGFLWNQAQDQRIRNTAAETDIASRSAGRARESVRDLEETVDRLSLICQAMWSLMQKQTGLSEEDLVREMGLLDAEEKSAEAKPRPEPKSCPSCQRANNRRRTHCLYCGTDIPDDSAFDRV